MKDSEFKESPGAWVITDVWSKTGVRITVKASGANTSAAIEDLYTGITYGIETHGWTTKTPEAPQAPSQVNIPIDDQGNTEAIPLPPGQRVYTVKELYHTKSRNGDKDLLKIVTVEDPYNTKYGVTAFNAPIQGWKDWPLETRYSAPEGCKQVVIEDPQKDGGYPTVRDMR